MKFYWKRVLVIAACCMMVLGLSACGESVDLNNYVQVTFRGYDGYGVAHVVFDEERFVSENPKASFKDSSVAECFRNGQIGFGVSKEEGLFNEEVIVLTWNCDEEALKKATGYAIECEDRNLTVKGLEEIPAMDAFEGIVVRYEGIAPRGKAVLDAGGVSECAKNLRYVLEGSSGLSNGDTVTVKIENNIPLDDIEYYMDLCGAVPQALEKEYVVEGLDTYITELAQIPEEKIQEMDERARQIMQDHVDEKWSENEELAGMELLGNYLLVQKKDGLNDKNRLFLIYKNTVINDDYPEGMDFYYYTMFKNIVVGADGNCVVELAAASVPQGAYSYTMGVTTGESFSDGGFWYYGFRDLETLFQVKIAPELFEYNYTSTVQGQWEQNGPSI